jgi:hypothetical protein
MLKTKAEIVCFAIIVFMIGAMFGASFPGFVHRFFS